MIPPLTRAGERPALLWFNRDMKLTRRGRRSAIGLVLALVVVAAGLWSGMQAPGPTEADVAREQTAVLGETSGALATDTLAQLPIKGRAPKTGYAREQFGAGWADVDACDMRQYILARDMTDETFDTDGCTVLTGRLPDPYTGAFIDFKRGSGTSDDVQIDHVVALSNAWQTGAQQLDEARRAEFANDPLNLLAVEGRANQQKSDADAATWLPPNKYYRCQYVARQIAVKHQYALWVTQAEHDAMAAALSACPEQRVPQQETE